MKAVTQLLAFKIYPFFVRSLLAARLKKIYLVGFLYNFTAKIDLFHQTVFSLFEKLST